MYRLFIRIGHSSVEVYKIVNRWNGQIKTEDFQNQMFHFQHLFLGVGIVGNVAKFGQFRWIYFFVFAEKYTQISSLMRLARSK